MKTNREILEQYDFQTSELDKAMKEARLDTLEHLVSLFQINSKKINGDTSIRIVNEVIEEIKK